MQVIVPANPIGLCYTGIGAYPHTNMTNLFLLSLHDCQKPFESFVL
jgi:hypothetical protein